MVWGGQNGSNRPQMAHGTPRVGSARVQKVPVARRLSLKVVSARWAGSSRALVLFWVILGLFRPILSPQGQWRHSGQYSGHRHTRGTKIGPPIGPPLACLLPDPYQKEIVQNQSAQSSSVTPPVPLPLPRELQTFMSPDARCCLGPAGSLHPAPASWSGPPHHSSL